MKIQTIGFIGFGLIGGSIARGLKQKQPSYRLLAYNYYEDRDNPRLSLAKQEGILDEICTDISDFRACDLIFLCAPVRSNISYLSLLRGIIKKDCMITDVGSVKQNIHDAVHALGLDGNFIGGHPMAGSEKTGYGNSDEKLLKNALYILTPTKETPEEATACMQEIVRLLEAVPLILDAAHHDDVAAAISHVPHVLSSALIHMIAGHEYEEEMCLLAAGAFRDMTRIAASSPIMWQDICLGNADSILRFIELYKKELSLFEEALEKRDEKALYNAFSEGKSFRDALYHGRKKAD